MAGFKRKIFYLGGFDPRGARFYHGLLAEQVEAHNRSGEAPALSLTPPRRKGRNALWTVTSDDGALTAEHEFLGWDDLVRLHWVKGRGALLAAMLTAYRGFLGQIDWTVARPVPRGSKFTLVYPGGSLVLLPLIVALLLWLPLHFLLPDWVAVPVALAAGCALAFALVKRIHSLWLLRFIIFNDLFARRRTDPALDARLDDFAATIDAALNDAHWDEILFVSHSNGSILAVPTMARLLERRSNLLPERFAMVTLGGSIPLIALRRDSAPFCADLDRLAAGDFRWLDIGSLTDGAAIPLVPPCLGRPVGPPPGLVQLSPRWFRYCEPATYAARRRNKYETHFDYLRRLDRPSPLDYLGLSASARPLDAAIAAFRAENADG